MYNKQLAEFNCIMQGIERVYEEYAKTQGLTYMSLTILQIIAYAEKPLTQKEICELSHYNKQIVNSVIKTLYYNEYVELKEVPSDRRNKFIVLTPYGKKYVEEILAPLTRIEEEAISVLTEEERVKMLEMMNKCYYGFKKAYLK